MRTVIKAKAAIRLLGIRLTEHSGAGTVALLCSYFIVADGEKSSTDSRWAGVKPWADETGSSPSKGGYRHESGSASINDCSISVRLLSTVVSLFEIDGNIIVQQEGSRTDLRQMNEKAMP
jgi:hypothetical protein